jgi:hypothetical protein
MDVIGDLGNPQKDAAALQPLLDRLLLALAAALTAAGQAITAFVQEPLK